MDMFFFGSTADSPHLFGAENDLLQEWSLAMKDILVDGKPLHVPWATLWYCAWILLGDSYSPQVATVLASVIEDTEIVELYELVFRCDEFGFGLPKG